MALFTLQDGTDIRLEHVTWVTPAIDEGTSMEHYDLHFSGGGHESVLESFKPRADFIALWSAA